MTSFYIKDQNGLHASFQTTTLISKSSNGELYNIKPSSTSELKGLVFKKFSKAYQSMNVQPKIEYMVNHQPQTDVSNDSKICWPSHCAYSQSKIKLVQPIS